MESELFDGCIMMHMSVGSRFILFDHVRSFSFEGHIPIAVGMLDGVNQSFSWLPSRGRSSA